ncbi:hypothetical protein FisN_34Lh052 [Fistulifera solaris]|uniref:Alpha/beta hydrolase fold-3 domain-containing protein n=1 Tax=Fistulifera solaris TaxID=1519565 RepID=A0A1Z5JHN4_FISSO|nr:hypothetical protein FisN_34Lh052 [Fistulifera solaris]|eukprot:GAX13446.1 hypothetical protein FisN_34Lh052 [Fistulifera solaris]
MPPEERDEASNCEFTGTTTNAMASFECCTSTLPYPKRPLEDINRGLNLNLGQNIISPNNQTLLWVIHFLDRLLVRWWEPYFQRLWKSIPLRLRQKLTFAAWNVYFPLHKRFLGRKTGIHPDASLEYHAMTTLAWWGRMIPVTIERMRFSLSQLSVWSKHPVLSRVEVIDEHIACHVPPDQHGHVRGLYVHVADEPTEYTLLWIYGGAFLAGDMEGNLGPAERVGRETGMDVLLVHHRLVPEVQMKDMLWDVALGYHWLTLQRKSMKVLVLGISSGAGLATRLCQSVAETVHGRSTLPDYLSSILQGTPVPAGAVLLGPFADYTTPRGSLLTNATHDLIVNPRVLESGLPYLETHMGGSRRDHSPIYRSFAGCPPLCVVTSEHEAVYDHAIDLVNAARSYGVPVTLGVWKYMCHVFTFLSSFVPEGEESMQFFIEWLKEQQQPKQ